MSRGFPSMTALLGLLAIAGYQNRDKIADMLRGGGSEKPTADNVEPQSSRGGFLAELASGGASVGEMLHSGLRELLDRFDQGGDGDTVNSWIDKGPNKPCTGPQLERALGTDVLNTLSAQTGLSRQELVERLCRELPDAVDRYTPQGRLPAEA